MCTNSEASPKFEPFMLEPSHRSGWGFTPLDGRLHTGRHPGEVASTGHQMMEHQCTASRLQNYASRSVASQFFWFLALSAGCASWPVKQHILHFD